jgi:hypothetical protein
MLLIGLDGQSVIIFRGYTDHYALYVLNLTNFSWFIPNVSGPIPRRRTFPQANVIGRYMVISFGKFNLIISFKLNKTNL